MNEILVPEDWSNKKLGDFVKLQGGYAFKSSEFTSKGIPIIRISNISNGIIGFSNAVYYKPNKDLNSFLVKSGDVLIAMSGATTGKIGLYNLRSNAYLNQRVGRFIIKNNKGLIVNSCRKLLKQINFMTVLLLMQLAVRNLI